MADWSYGGAYERHPCETGLIVFEDGSTLKTHDINDGCPGFMKQADIIFTDSPWNTGNLRSFYTKAGKEMQHAFGAFRVSLFDRIQEVNPRVCYLEIGKEFLPEFVLEMRRLYKYVTFYNSSYYHRAENHCYIVRGSNKARPVPKLDGMDEEDVVAWVCENEEYDCIGDFCMGQGLVAVNAAKNGKRFVGTELNHKRLAVTIERVTELGLTYRRVDE